MTRRKYTRNEEIANTVSHGIGILLGVAAGVWLLLLALRTHNLWAVSSVLVYVVCMLFSYFASTFYHACKEARRKRMLRKLDHIAIYFHIAGTYTFFTLTVLRNTAYWGWALFVVVWVAAFAGSYVSFKGKGTGHRIETACYVAMGFVVCVAFKPLIDTLRPIGLMDAFWYLMAGGASYILGAILYSFKKVPYIHSIFHIFVIGGSIFHILAIANVLYRLQ